MKNKKEDTKIMLSNSFKKLMLSHSFEKITIKMITDEANLIRPSFYNHFADKYELLEWICHKDIFEGAMLLISNNMYHEAINFIFTSIENNKDFYLKAIKVQGQNSSEDILSNGLLEMFHEFFAVCNKADSKFGGILTANDIAKYYSKGLSYFIITWLEKGGTVPASEIAHKYTILVSTSLDKLILDNF